MRIFHTADIHFGVENYGKIDPKTGIHTRLGDFSLNLGRLVECALDERIDLVLFCGDAYKTAYPTPTQQKLFAQHMLRLQAAGIPVVIVVGNHDHPLSFGKAHALDVFSYLPVQGFHVFSKPDLMVIQTKSGPVQVVGMPWPMRHFLLTNQEHRFKTHAEIADYISEKVGSIIQSFAQQIDTKIPAILAGHLTVSSGIFSGSEKCAIYGTDPIFLPSQLALEQFDYVALGHLHRHQNLNEKGIPVVYSGSLERIDFGERKETKGFCSVAIEGTGDVKQTSYQFKELPTRPMIQIEAFLVADKDQTEQLVAAIERYVIKDAIIKILYHLPEGKADRVDLGIVQEACSQAHYMVGIFPIHKPLVRERRAALKINMDFATLLSRYFESKDQLHARKATLIEKAFGLQQELEAKQQQQEAE